MGLDVITPIELVNTLNENVGVNNTVEELVGVNIHAVEIFTKDHIEIIEPLQNITEHSK